MLIKITPKDSLFLGKGKPFTNTESAWVQSYTVPMPTVFWGAIYSAILSKDKVLWDCIQKYSHSQTKIEQCDFLENLLHKLTIDQLFIINEETRELYVKAPQDLYVDEFGNAVKGIYKDNEEKKAEIERNAIDYRFFDEMLYPPEEWEEGAEKYYISISDLINFYSKIPKRINLIHEDEIFVITQKLGIQRSKSKGSIEEGKLYKRDQVQFKDSKYSYLISCHIDKTNMTRIENKDKFEGVLKLGGEGRTASYEKCESKLLNEIIENFQEYYKEQGFSSYKVVFTSPYLWDKQEKNEHLVLKSNLDMCGEITNRAFVYDKKIKTGFYDMLKNETKTLNCLPAGAVYRFSLKNACSYSNVKESIEKILELQSDYSFKGFNSFILIGEEK